MTPPSPASNNPSNENEPEDEPDGEPEIPAEVFEVLKHELRRALVAELIHKDDLALVTLASRVAADADAQFPDMVIELHDVHLPKLTGCGLIDYDSSTGDISLALPPETVETALNQVEGDDA